MTPTDVFQAAPALTGMAARGLVLLAAACACGWLLRRCSAARRRDYWTAVMVALLVLPMLSWILPGWRVLPRWSAADAPKGEARPVAGHAGASVADRPTAANADRSGMTRADESSRTSPPSAEPSGADAAVSVEEPQEVSPESPPAPVRVAAPADRGGSDAHAPWGLGAWLIAAWGVGVLLAAAPLAMGRLALRRLAGKARRLDDRAEWSDLVRQARTAVGLTRPVRVLESDRDLLPMVWGLRRATLLLPRGAGQWSPARAQAVMRHEFAHVVAADCASKTLGRIACAVHWYNPLAWWALGRMEREAERAADDAVLRAGTHPADYAQDLLGIATGTWRARGCGAAAIAMARKDRLERRLLAVLDGSRRRSPAGPAGRFALFGLLVLLAVPLAVLRAGPRAADAPDQPQVAYVQDFEGEVGPEWSRRGTAVTPLGWRRYLGDFKSESVRLSLDGLDEHRFVRLTMDVIVATSWDGTRSNWGPDAFGVRVDGGPVLMRTTFSNVGSSSPNRPMQAFPNEFPFGPDHPAQTGAIEKNTLGFVHTFKDRKNPWDALYRMSLVFPHDAPDLRLVFRGQNLAPRDDEKWGLDNVKVELLTGPVELSADRMEQLWVAMSSDPMRAMRAQQELISAGDAAAAFLAEKVVEPLPDEQQVRAWLGALNDANARERKDLLVNLRRAGSALRPAYDKAAAEVDLDEFFRGGAFEAALRDRLHRTGALTQEDVAEALRPSEMRHPATARAPAPLGGASPARADGPAFLRPPDRNPPAAARGLLLPEVLSLVLGQDVRRQETAGLEAYYRAIRALEILGTPTALAGLQAAVEDAPHERLRAVASRALLNAGDRAIQRRLHVAREALAAGLADEALRQVRSALATARELRNPLVVELRKVISELQTAARTGTAPKAGTIDIGPRRVWVELPDGVPMELIRIPPGTVFAPEPGQQEFGEAPGGGRDHTRSRVTIDRAIYVSATEVTNLQYAAVTGEYLTHPGTYCGSAAQGVSFDDAASFCARVGQRLGMDARPPTLDEWRYLLHAGLGRATDPRGAGRDVRQASRTKAAGVHGVHGLYDGNAEYAIRPGREGDGFDPMLVWASGEADRPVEPDRQDVGFHLVAIPPAPGEVCLTAPVRVEGFRNEDGALAADVNVEVGNATDRPAALTVEFDGPDGCRWVGLVPEEAARGQVEPGASRARLCRLLFVGETVRDVHPLPTLRTSRPTAPAELVERPLAIDLEAVGLLRPPVCRVPRIAGEITLDGRADEKAWRESAGLAPLLTDDARRPDAPGTSVRLAHDGEMLYVAVRSEETAERADKLAAEATERDGEVWKDDSIELFFDADMDRATYVQLIANSVGTQFDAKGYDRTWDADWRVGAARSDNAWTLEFAVPLKSLGITPAGPGRRIGFNVCRTRVVGEEPQRTMWSPTFSPSNHRPRHFGVIVLE